MLTAKKVKEMDEVQINSYRKTLIESWVSTAKYDITYEEILIRATPYTKNNVCIVPLSLEQNSTVLGQ